jgi:hypothetical protein
MKRLSAMLALGLTSTAVFAEIDFSFNKSQRTMSVTLCAQSESDFINQALFEAVSQKLIESDFESFYSDNEERTHFDTSEKFFTHVSAVSEGLDSSVKCLDHELPFTMTFTDSMNKIESHRKKLDCRIFPKAIAVKIKMKSIVKILPNVGKVKDHHHALLSTDPQETTVRYCDKGKIVQSDFRYRERSLAKVVKNPDPSMSHLDIFEVYDRQAYEYPDIGQVYNFLSWLDQ